MVDPMVRSITKKQCIMVEISNPVEDAPNSDEVISRFQFRDLNVCTMLLPKCNAKAVE